MLKSDRKKVSRWISILEKLQADLESMVSALDDKVSSRSEKFAESDKGQGAIETQVGGYAIRAEYADGTLEDSVSLVSSKVLAIRIAKKIAHTSTRDLTVAIWVDDTRTDCSVFKAEVRS